MNNSTSFALITTSSLQKMNGGGHLFNEEGMESMANWRPGERKKGRGEQGGREVMLDGDSRKTERAKDRTESGLEECHGPESSPCISTQYPLLSPKIIERKQGKPREGMERHEHNKQMCRLARA